MLVLKKYLSNICDFLYNEFPCCLPLEVFNRIRIHNGFKIYASLLEKYGDSVSVSICPYKGTGDVYLAAGYFNKSALKTENYVFCVIGKSNEAVAELFGIENVLEISQKQMSSLFRFAVFTGMKETEISILHPNPQKDHVGVIDYFRNINGLNFADIIRYSSFAEKAIDAPVFPDCDDKMKSLFSRLNLKEGKTILLAPYSYTLEKINGLFWRKLVEELNAMGYSVCTNLGSDKEKAIEGTEGVFLKYEELASFLKMGGYFISVRSGLCEIVSTIPCKKIILYKSYLFWGNGNIVDYFGMKNMRLCEDVIELEYSGIDFYTLIDDIKNNLEMNICTQ